MKYAFLILLCLLVSCRQPEAGPDRTILVEEEQEELTLLPEILEKRDFSSELMLKLLNDERAKHNLEPMIIDERLQKSAQKHADWMADNQKMSHKGENGSSPSTRIKKEGLNYSSCAENVAYGQRDEKDVTVTWIHSSGHHRNMLSSNKLVGFGGTKSSNGQIYWVQAFATEEKNESVFFIIDNGVNGFWGYARHSKFHLPNLCYGYGKR